jgi:hypothetical protein
VSIIVAKHRKTIHEAKIANFRYAELSLCNERSRGASRARRTDSTDPVRRLANPFRRELQFLLTGRLYKPTAVKYR